MLGVSLLLFRQGPKSTAGQLIRAASGALAPPRQGWIGANMPVMLMYLPVHVFFALWVLSFVFLPQRLALSCWAAFLLPYYLLTHRGNPAHTGRACFELVRPFFIWITLQKTNVHKIQSG